MRFKTPTNYRHLNIYSIFTRNFSEEGTFEAVIPELDRIKKLGIDIIWFMPFYPLGVKNRKGSVGSPYSIRNYYEIDPSHGTMEDFEKLVSEIHRRDMKVMIDIVFNHTAPDSVLVKEHPEWFYKTPEGNFGNRVGDWSDIIDLDYRHQGLWDYKINILKFWAKKVDGFRVDVAPLVPIEFWEQARKEVSEINPDLIWLSESVEPNFIRFLRSENLVALSDAEIFSVFDMAYDYDITETFEAYLDGKIPLSQHVQALNRQETAYPSDYVKMRHLENHDRERIASRVLDINDLRQWTAFTYLQKGATLIYNGQEFMNPNRPSLFDKDVIDWNVGEDHSEYFAKLSKIQKEYVPTDNRIYELIAYDEIDTIVMTYRNKDEFQLGVFNVKSSEGQVKVPLKDGEYLDLITDKKIKVQNQTIDIPTTPIFIKSTLDAVL